jgi:hypothetical protein
MLVFVCVMIGFVKKLFPTLKFLHSDDLALISTGAGGAHGIEHEHAIATTEDEKKLSWCGSNKHKARGALFFFIIVCNVIIPIVWTVYAPSTVTSQRTCESYDSHGVSRQETFRQLMMFYNIILMVLVCAVMPCWFSQWLPR